MSDKTRIAWFLACSMMLFLLSSFRNPVFSVPSPPSQRTVLTDPSGDTGIHGADADITEVSFAKNSGMLDVVITIAGDFFHREYSFFVEFYLSPDVQPTRLSMGHGNRTLLLSLVTSGDQYQASLIISDRQLYFPLTCHVSDHVAFIYGIPANLLKGQNTFWATVFSQIDYAFWSASQNSSTPLSMHLLWKAFDLAPDEGLFKVVFPTEILKLDNVQIEGETAVGKTLTLFATFVNENDLLARNVKLTIESSSLDLSILQDSPNRDIAPHQAIRFPMKITAKAPGAHPITLGATVDGWRAEIINEQRGPSTIVVIKTIDTPYFAVIGQWILVVCTGFILTAIIAAKRKLL
jgi:hypothetical protein